jgi:aspartyl-tRNA(Asn)/glutamyl-tRNA(Gln) amidotransferase subunit C
MNDDIDIENLANLARIDISDKQADELADSISDILEYVDSVEEVAGDDNGDGPHVGPVHNVLREDKNPHEPGAYRDQLLAEAPDTEGGNVVVPPIL